MFAHRSRTIFPIFTGNTVLSSECITNGFLIARQRAAIGLEHLALRTARAVDGALLPVILAIPMRVRYWGIFRVIPRTSSDRTPILNKTWCNGMRRTNGRSIAVFL